MRYGRKVRAIGMVLSVLLLVSAGCSDVGVSSNSKSAIRAESMAQAAVFEAADDSSGRRSGGRTASTGSANAKYQLAAKYAESSAAPADPVNLGILTATQPDRHLIKNATVSLEVEAAQPAVAQLVQSVQELGGYVSRQQERLDQFKRRSVYITVRVPATAFDGAMLTLDSLGTVLERQVSTEDVTEEFVDTEAKMRNLKKTEERILQHLERTAKLEDILKAEQELSRYREQIEQHEGRLRFLGDRVAFSTINITINEAAKAEPIAPAESFSSGQVFSRATRALMIFARGLWIRVIWLIVWSPVWLVLLGIALVIRRIVKKYSMQD